LVLCRLLERFFNYDEILIVVEVVFMKQRKHFFYCVFFGLVCLFLTTVSVDALILGNTYTSTSFHTVSRWIGGVKLETIIGNLFISNLNGHVTSIWAYLKCATGSEEVVAGMFEPGNPGSYINHTEEKTISSSTAKWYQFNFTAPYPVIEVGYSYMFVIYGDAPDSNPGDSVYIQIGRLTITGSSYWIEADNSYSDDFGETSWTPTEQTGYTVCLYASVTSESGPIPMGGVSGAKWRLMSVPLDEDDIDFDELRFVNATQNYSYSDAVTNGVVLNSIYGWDIAGQSYTIATDFDSYDGYWMYLYKSDYSLWVNTSSDDGGSGDFSEDDIAGAVIVTVASVLVLSPLIVDTRFRKK